VQAIGVKTGCWKAGVLVEDDNGSVAMALKELEGVGLTAHQFIHK
jgi:hypothetical protein